MMKEKTAGKTPMTEEAPRMTEKGERVEGWSVNTEEMVEVGSR
jgi:hypothetical protein